jgi:hypothetical protein
MRLLPSDLTVDLQKLNNQKIQSIYGAGVIDNNTKHSLKTNITNQPRIGGLSKIHRPNTSLCRIVSTSTKNTSNYPISGYLAKFLGNTSDTPLENL